MLRTILVALDESEQSRRAFELSLEIAAKFYAKLLLVNVVRAIEVEAMFDRGEDYYRLLCEEAKGKGIWCKYRVELGHPVEQILLAAEDIHADLIVIGQSNLRRGAWNVFGSMSQRILRDAPCPVTVIN